MARKLTPKEVAAQLVADFIQEIDFYTGGTHPQRISFAKSLSTMHVSRMYDQVGFLDLSGRLNNAKERCAFWNKVHDEIGQITSL